LPVIVQKYVFEFDLHRIELLVAGRSDEFVARHRSKAKTRSLAAKLAPKTRCWLKTRAADTLKGQSRKEIV
jgi:hypothetical protein